MRSTIVFLLFFTAFATAQFWSSFLEDGKKVLNAIEGEMETALAGQSNPVNKLFFGAQGAIACDLEKDLNTIMDSNCNHLFSRKRISLPVPKNVDDKKWQAFTARLKVINKVDIILDGTTITKLDLHLEKGVKGLEEFKIVNNPHLEYINITAKGDKNSINIVHLDITGNPKLKVFELRTKIFKSGLTIENNGLLVNLDWAINEYSDGNTVLSKGLIIRNNPNLGREEWLTINATSIAVRRFHFTENTGVDRVMLTTKSIDIMDDLVIANNDMLTGFTIGSPDMKKFWMAKWTVKENILLKDVWAVPWKKLTQSTLLTILGNPVLKQDYINQFKKFITYNTSSQVQFFGECQFSKPVSNLGHLKSCKTVQGDLKLTPGAGGSAGNNQIGTIYGNVYLADIKPGRLGFLKGTKMDTGKTIRSGVCTFPEKIHMHTVVRPKCPSAPTTEKPNTMQATSPNGLGGKPGNYGVPQALQGSTTTKPEESSMTTIIIVIVIIVIVVLVAGGLVWFFMIRKKRAKKTAKSDASKRPSDSESGRGLEETSSRATSVGGISSRLSESELEDRGLTSKASSTVQDKKSKTPKTGGKKAKK